MHGRAQPLASAVRSTTLTSQHGAPEWCVIYPNYIRKEQIDVSKSDMRAFVRVQCSPPVAVVL